MSRMTRLKCKGKWRANYLINGTRLVRYELLLMSRRSENTALNLQSSQLKLNKYDVLFFVIEQVMETKEIPVKNIHGFLDHLKDAYEGIDEEMRKKMNGIQWGSEWSHKIIEFKNQAENESGAKYAMVVFVKSKDGKFVDCMYLPLQGGSQSRSCENPHQKRAFNIVGSFEMGNCGRESSGKSKRFKHKTTALFSKHQGKVQIIYRIKLLR